MKIFEYQPTMIHAKTMVADGLFSMFGSSNLDARSSEINEELDVVRLRCRVQGDGWKQRSRKTWPSRVLTRWTNRESLGLGTIYGVGGDSLSLAAF